MLSWQIGVVEAIAAPSMIRIEFTGKGGHGGGMPMKQRRAVVPRWQQPPLFRKLHVHELTIQQNRGQ